MLFSVIIPTYNREKEISRAINSVLNQTFSDFEIIVIDDGSTDNTESVIKSFEDSRIVYIKQLNSGATSARNNGIIHSSGYYVAFLDSDDIWYPTFLEEHYERYKSDLDVSIVYSDLNIKKDNKVYSFSKPLGLEGYVYKDVLKQGYLSPTICLSTKRECLSNVGMFDVNLPASQDDDICIKLSKEYKVGFVNKKLAAAIVSSNNRISSSSLRVAMGWWKLWNKYEVDVVANCGDSVMAKHYLECVHHFAVSGNREMTNVAKNKCIVYGGHVNIISACIINLGLKYSSFRNFREGRAMRKVLRWCM